MDRRKLESRPAQGGGFRAISTVRFSSASWHVNKDTERRQHIVFLLQCVVYLQRNVIGIILHFQV